MKTNGYVEMTSPDDYPGKRYRRNRIYVHHYVWWKNTGHILRRDELIHHKNEIKDDNEFDNLQLLKRGKHTKIHDNRVVTMVCFRCPCGKQFEREKRQTHLIKKKNKSTYCSRRCSGKYSRKNIESELIGQ